MMGPWGEVYYDPGHAGADEPDIAAAEQRGREDNADHSMCYVHGSRALEALLAAERARALRDAAESAARAGRVGYTVAELYMRADQETA